MVRDAICKTPKQAIPHLFSCFRGLNGQFELLLIVYYCFKMRICGWRAYRIGTFSEIAHIDTHFQSIKIFKLKERFFFCWAPVDCIHTHNRNDRYVNCLLSRFQFLFRLFLIHLPCGMRHKKKIIILLSHFRQLQTMRKLNSMSDSLFLILTTKQCCRSSL